MLQDIADDDWILRDTLRPALHALTAAGLRFDALIKPAHLLVVLRLCERHPDLPIVIDHGAKPDIAWGTFQPWADDIVRVARDTRAFCKLSGLVTEAAPNWQVDDLRRYTDHLLDRFGPRRVMWGSDWPVVELAGGYARWRTATIDLLAGLPASERDMVLGSTAVAFYGLEPG